jgi:hypothetical protein
MLIPYLHIAEKLIQNGIAWIDLDQGQLLDPESYDSILTPGVLVAIPKADTTYRSDGSKQYYLIMTTKTVLSIQNDTHVTHVSDLQSFADKLSDLELADTVSDCVCDCISSCTETEYKEYYNDTFYVVEHTYSGIFIKDATKPKTLTIGRDVNIVITPQLHHGQD